MKERERKKKKATPVEAGSDREVTQIESHRAILRICSGSQSVNDDIQKAERFDKDAVW